MKKFVSCPLGEYLQLDEDEIRFKKEQHIAYAVCSKKCGNMQFIVDGQTQVCPKCGKLMFRAVVKKYQLIEE
ncbi:MAG TPA: hypothetical protein PL044_03155 [Clostridiales bacterium]|nr:hypothetical protein [Clostridiales bacterium]HQH62330.1 hypothetical protein [Clostridiales bacterium]HQK72760.1 hypothetical protein [Clostridiales bacterium]